MTGGGKATGKAKIGAEFTAWDGYIKGKNLKLFANKEITQSWRASDFPKGAPDSKLVITLTAVEGGTEMSIYHSKLPEGMGSSYRDGWIEYYFKPMKKFFDK